MRNGTFLVALLLLIGCDVPDVFGSAPAEPERPTDAPVPLGPEHVPGWGELPVPSEERIEQISRGYSPQVGARSTLFSATANRELPADGRALLFCRVEVNPGRRYDAGSLPDPNLQVRVGEGPVHTMSGGEDILRWHFSVPVSELHDGSRVWMRVIDEDVFSHDTIEEHTVVVIDGSPILSSKERSVVECRVADPAIVESASQDAVDSANRAIDHLEAQLTPRATHPQLGYPAEEVDEARLRLRSVAAWRGWDSSEVAALKDRHAALDATWSTRARSLLDERRALLPEPLAENDLGAGMSLRARPLGCGLAGIEAISTYSQELSSQRSDRCYVMVELRKSSGRDIQLGHAGSELGPFAPIAISSVDGEGRMKPAHIVRQARDGRALAEEHELTLSAGDRVEVLLEVAPVDGGDPAAIRELWVRSEGRPHLVRIR